MLNVYEFIKNSLLIFLLKILGEIKALGKGNQKKDGFFSFKIDPINEVICPLYEVIIEEEKKMYYNVLYDFKIFSREGILTRRYLNEKYSENSNKKAGF